LYVDNKNTINSIFKLDTRFYTEAKCKNKKLSFHKDFKSFEQKQL